MISPFRALGNLFREGVLSRLVGSPATSSSSSPVFGRGAFIPLLVRTTPQGPGQRQFHTTTTTTSTGNNSISVYNVMGNGRGRRGITGNWKGSSSSSLPALTVGGGPSTLLNGYMMMGPFASMSKMSHVKTYQGKVRIGFPRPRDSKRIKVHGWKRRMETPSQRQIIMRRILKGKHILSHDP